MVKGKDLDFDGSSDHENFPKDTHKLWELFRRHTKPNSQKAVSSNAEETKQVEHVAPNLLSPTTSATHQNRPITMPPRQKTFERQKSERRDNLQTFEESRYDTRTSMETRERANSEAPAFPKRANIQPANPIGGNSVSDFRTLRSNGARKGPGSPRRLITSNYRNDEETGGWEFPGSPGRPPSDYSGQHIPDEESISDLLNSPAFWDELGRRFNLCLSMQFRDGSDREKFFVTYIKKPNLWLRITISCDYREAPENSLETLVKSLHYQRDKIARIYEAIKDSLEDIQFYNTVTNLKLQTIDKRLHVHVAEDLNEITEFPLLSSINHLHFYRHDNIVVRESDVFFESHLSGFVYRVSVQGSYYIKKEISSPDTVEEFLYEINALAALRQSKGVIDLVGVVADDSLSIIKGLLIEWAPGGSIADYIFENRDKQISWARREKWARQVVAGISDIHEAGFVQGDCTISNIVLDNQDSVRIVDINRRGCPIGCEPPEFEGLIRDEQKVSMYIGVKSDLYQLGMILWAIARLIEEPERQEKPLTLDNSFPQYYRDIVYACLSESPTDRLPARSLLELFPPIDDEAARPPSPLSAAGLEDLREHERVHSNYHRPNEPPVPTPPSVPHNTTFIPEEIDQDTLLAGMDHFSEDSARPSVLELPPHVNIQPGDPLSTSLELPSHLQSETAVQQAAGEDTLAGADIVATPQRSNTLQAVEGDALPGKDDATHFHGLTHQDSGLPIELDENDDPGFDSNHLHRQRQIIQAQPQGLQLPDADGRIVIGPVHQDSGFSEQLPDPDQSSSLAVKASLSTHSEKQQEEDQGDPPATNNSLG